MKAKTKWFGVQHRISSMDGRGRVIDSIFIERFWRTVKYKYICICSFDDGAALQRGLAGFMNYYNEQRTH